MTTENTPKSSSLVQQLVVAAITAATVLSGLFTEVPRLTRNIVQDELATHQQHVVHHVDSLFTVMQDTIEHRFEQRADAAMDTVLKHLGLVVTVPGSAQPGPTHITVARDTTGEAAAQHRMDLMAERMSDVIEQLALLTVEVRRNETQPEPKQRLERRR